MYAADAPPPFYIEWVHQKILTWKIMNSAFQSSIVFKSKKWTIYTLYELIMTHCQIDLK